MLAILIMKQSSCNPSKRPSTDVHHKTNSYDPIREKVNGQDQIQALVDKQKVIITKESIRSDIHFDDAEGTDCLPNDTLFEELARMGYEKPSQSAKTTAWNEFSSTMASGIICLANNQKFNFSKYILDNMVKILEGGVKFFMFPRFLKVFLNKQVDGMNKHKETFVVSSHTKKVFANMRRQSDGFSGVVTPLFDNMLIQASEEIGEDSGHLTNSTQIPIDDQPSTSTAPKKTQKSRWETKEEESKDCLGKGDCHFKEKSQEARKEEKVKTYRIQKLNDEEMFGVNYLHGEEVTVEDTAAEVIVTAASTIHVTTAEVVTTVSAPTTNIEELTLAQTFIEIKAAKPKTIKAVTTDATSVTTVATTVSTTAVTRPKAKGIMFHDQEEQVFVSKPIVSSTQFSIKDKGKGIMIEPERPLKRKDQIAADEELARQLEAEMQAEIEKEERIRRKKEEEANLALIELWENKQAMMEADRLLAERLQTREREELTIEEKSKLFVALMNKGRKHFAELRAQEKRNKPPTKAQKRSQMSTYLRHMGNYKHSHLKGKTYEEIERLFEKEMERVNSFIPMDADDRTGKEQERSSKRSGDDLQSNVSKKQKVVEQVETEKVDDLKEEEMKKHIEIVRDDNTVIDVVPLATKPPTIVGYKIIKAG
ncbi:hypothetical protein Tco_0649768, partial [Tanacetum coccineum]